MRNVWLIILMFPLLSFQCEDDVVYVSLECLEVKYITGICGEVVLQIQNPDQYGFGENWNGYENVFFADINCTNVTIPENDNSFFVQLLTNRPIDKPGDCARCLATIGYTGTKRYEIRNTSERCQ